MAERTDADLAGSDAETAEAGDSLEPCTVCGDPVETGRWHPVALDTDADDPRLRVFCSTACREEWDD